MKEIDIAVVGSGIGGTLISALNSDKNLILFERDSNLGGCASTFSRFGLNFNTGATTFVGYEDGHILKNMFEKIGFKPDIKKSNIAIRVIQEDKKLDRVENFEEFLEQIQSIYPHKNNRVFWNKIKQLDEKFWKLEKFYFNKYSLKTYIKTFAFVMELLKEFKFLLFKSAKSYIEEVLYDISDEYKAFIDAQLMITLQAPHKEISLVSMSLGLAYPFHKVFYANSGMGNLIENLLKDVHVKKNEEVILIKRQGKEFIMQTSKDIYLAKKVILNSTIYNSAKLFEDKAIQNYYEGFSFSDQSAFVVYLHVKCYEELLHHYQLILKKDIPNAISKSFFVSISDKKDKKLSLDGYSVTISTHTKAAVWTSLSKDDYKIKKQETEEFIIKEFQKEFPQIKIIRAFSSTSKTFQRYIARSNCGGRAITLKNIFDTPSCNTPFKNLYNVGDTVFAGQGWPGVTLGVKILNEEINN